MTPSSSQVALRYHRVVRSTRYCAVRRGVRSQHVFSILWHLPRYCLQTADRPFLLNKLVMRKENAGLTVSVSQTGMPR